MNHEANARFARVARNGGHSTLPTLFVHAHDDWTCETVPSRLAEPMRASVARLTEARVASGHWMG
jgi:hypothetical protein